MYKQNNAELEGEQMIRIMLTSLSFLTIVITIPEIAKSQVPGEMQRIYVLGAVNNPADFEYKEGITVKDAIELAGGLAPNADKKGVMLISLSGSRQSLDIDAIISGKENFILKPGDTIVVKPIIAVNDTKPEPATISVRITGMVNKPGSYQLKVGATVAEALAAAGGAAETADLKSAFIRRKGETIALSVESIHDEKKIVEDGDEILVPEFVVTISGEVEKPGSYALIPSKTNNIGMLLQIAGGAKRTADLSKIKITRRSNREISITADCRKAEILSKTQLLSGDTVFVPKAQQSVKIKALAFSILAIIIIL